MLIFSGTTYYYVTYNVIVIMQTALYCPSCQVEHELLIKELNTHLYLKSEKSRQKRTKLAAYMTDNASVGARGLCPHVHLNHPVVDNPGKGEML